MRREPVVVVVPTDHPLAKRKELALGDVADDPWITTPVDELGPVLLRDLGRRQELGFEGDDFRTALRLVAEGLGVALLPELALVDAPRGVTGRPLSEPRLTRNIYTCRLDTRHVAASIARLEDYLEQAAAR